MTTASITSNGHLWVRNQRAGEVLPRIRRGEGAYLFDETGKRYLDGSGGPVLSCIGHGNREVIDAIRQQLDRFEFAFCGHFTTDAIDALAETIVAEAGLPYQRVSFVSGWIRGDRDLHAHCAGIPRSARRTGPNAVHLASPILARVHPWRIVRLGPFHATAPLRTGVDAGHFFVSCERL